MPTAMRGLVAALRVPDPGLPLKMAERRRDSRAWSSGIVSTPRPASGSMSCGGEGEVGGEDSRGWDATSGRLFERRLAGLAPKDGRGWCSARVRPSLGWSCRFER